MTKLTNRSEVAYDLAHRIAEAVSALGASVDVGMSNQSCSSYVTFSFDDSEETCIRISDHEARSYNRAGDFRIAIAGMGDDHAFIAETAHYERYEFTAIEWDADGEPLEFDATTVECDEFDEDAEMVGWTYDADHIEAAFEAAVAFAAARA